MSSECGRFHFVGKVPQWFENSWLVADSRFTCHCSGLSASLEESGKGGMLESAAESAWIVSWKDQSFSSCRISMSFRNLVCVFLKGLCILDGLECDFSFSQN